MQVDGSLPSIIQGVSQQDPRDRRPGQCSLQENFSADPVRSLSRRLPTNFVAELLGSGYTFRDVSLGLNSNFFIGFKAGSVRAISCETGQEIPVNDIDGAMSYITGSSIALGTLDGVTYVSNTTLSAAMAADVREQLTTGALVFALGGQYGRTYTVNIAWSGGTISASYVSPDGSSSAHIERISTDYIINELQDNLTANATFAANFEALRTSDVLYIRKTSAPTTESFTVTVSDGEGGANLLAVNNSVKSVGSLPRYAPHGYTVSVYGDGQANEDDWYLEFQADPDNAGAYPNVGDGFGRAGKWVETTKPGITYVPDLSTWPHVLEYDAGNQEFSFRRGTWASREVGDLESNKDPSFIGRPVVWITHFQERLVFVTKSSAVMSRTNKPQDFFRQSGTALLDTDPIDLNIKSPSNTRVAYAIPHNRDLVFFGDAGQFIVFGRNKLTPTNCSAVLTTEFKASLNAAPSPAGQVIFFPSQYGLFTNIREFFTQAAADTNDSRNVTRHVPKYITGDARRIIATSDLEIALIQGTSELNKLFVYEYVWADQEKVQSAWSTWTFHSAIEHAFFVSTKLYLLFNTGTSYSLEYIDFNINNDAGLEYQSCMDRKRSLVVSGNTIPNPYTDMPSISNILVVQGSDCPNPGLSVQIESNTPTELILNEDMGGGTVYIGINYPCIWRPTIPFITDRNGQKVDTANLVISKFLLSYRDSGGVSARLVSNYMETEPFELPVRKVGTPTFIVGEPAIGTGKHSIPFRQKIDDAEIEIRVDGPLPFTALDLGWIGQYSKTGKRV